MRLLVVWLWSSVHGMVFISHKEWLIWPKEKRKQFWLHRQILYSLALIASQTQIMHLLKLLVVQITYDGSCLVMISGAPTMSTWKSASQNISPKLLNFWTRCVEQFRKCISKIMLSRVNCFGLLIILSTQVKLVVSLLRQDGPRGIKQQGVRKRWMLVTVMISLMSIMVTGIGQKPIDLVCFR